MFMYLIHFKVLVTKMHTIKLSTCRGYINIVSPQPMKQEGKEIQLENSYELELHPDDGIFIIMNTEGSLETGQKFSIGFHCKDDSEYRSPYFNFIIKY